MKDELRTPTVFVSHSSKDKPTARRIARRLEQFGMEVWLDERELKFGDRLFDRFREEIRRRDFFVLVLTRNAARSHWVRREIRAARLSFRRGPVVLALRIEPKIDLPVSTKHKAVDLFNPFEFEDQFARLAETMLERPIREVDRALLKRHIDEACREEAGLAVLFETVNGRYALDEERANLVMRRQPDRHMADFALLCAYELGDSESRDRIASDCLSWTFRNFGVGFHPLRMHLRQEAGNTYSLLLASTGTKLQDGPHIDAAFLLFEATPELWPVPFASFVNSNFDQFSEDQKERAVSYLLKNPIGPGKGVALLADHLLRHMPYHAALVHLWKRWVDSGFFEGNRGLIYPALFRGLRDDGLSASAAVLFDALNRGAAVRHPGFASVDERLAYMVRAQMSQLDTALRAIDFVLTARLCGYHAVDKLDDELRRALGGFEWKGFDADNELYQVVDQIMFVYRLYDPDTDWIQQPDQAKRLLSELQAAFDAAGLMSGSR